LCSVIEGLYSVIEGLCSVIEGLCGDYFDPLTLQAII
jgi:hypothetical protein